ncbi:hypothetical protein SDJN02_11338, partial [Cucurbita argyrosperma subsp. argyrosperma]
MGQIPTPMRLPTAKPNSGQPPQAVARESVAGYFSMN